jgi:nucleolar MIF4G domain-containing protein 1
LGSEREEKRITLACLSKQFLSRLAETNMHGIAREVEGLYRQFSRNDVNMTLTGWLLEVFNIILIHFLDLLINSLVAPVYTPTCLVMEHVMLLAILHANAGIEVGHRHHIRGRPHLLAGWSSHSQDPHS